MDTKWKNKMIVGVWLLLFTLGASGIITFLFSGNQYMAKDYFHTPMFQMQLDEFSSLLYRFEMNDMSLEEAKKQIVVTEAEINEHRYRFGNLTEQIESIKAQYEGLIQQAREEDNKEIADAYIKERDAKIADITKNFTSDEHIRAKIVKEKELRLQDYYQERQKYRSNFSRYEEAFAYAFKNSETGEDYSNVDGPDHLNKENMLYVTTHTITEDSVHYFGFPGQDVVDSLYTENGAVFEGEIGVKKSAPSTNPVMMEYENYKQNRIVFWVYTLVGFLALILSISFWKKTKTIPTYIEKWRPHYNKLPIDARVVLFGTASILAMISLFWLSDEFRYFTSSPFESGRDILFALVFSSIFSGFTLVQGNLLVAEIKDFSNLKEQWDRSVLNKAWLAIKEAFLIKSIGVQTFIFLSVIFALGAAAFMVLFDPAFLLIYVLLLALVGIPIVILLFRRIGYFNRIIHNTNELAEGNLGQDLPVKGKFVLAILAQNINILRQSVKISLKEQAKSERLKTELITNVSHDLRTPLTSVITYTELLKDEALSADERSAYLEIIDRKSKRLKVLIDDLFEVSKMASGNMELIKEKVDLVQLLQQALAEHDTSINASTLQFRVTNSQKPVNALVDGQKLWRVFDNLIGNILKYSLEHTRVYITVSTKADKAILTFKNISKYELGDNSEELFERFKRGDQSRHTEGSGLGLAIAKSIVDLHDGSLDIDADGDLFKVTISLDLAE